MTAATLVTANYRGLLIKETCLVANLQDIGEIKILISKIKMYTSESALQTLQTEDGKWRYYPSEGT
jgi:hypothetical protein